MPVISLVSETDFDGWRKAARILALNEVPPDDVSWRVQADAPGLFEPAAPPPPYGLLTVPAQFVALSQAAVLHRDDRRFDRLYRLLWRLRHHHSLLSATSDRDVARISAMAKAVHRDKHRMQALVRFREIGREQKSHYVAWFEPKHHIVAAAAPLFARRFADMPWSILTPNVCAHWDGHAVEITPGVSKAQLPTPDRLEEIWRRDYASTFNPTRPTPKAMRNRRVT